MYEINDAIGKTIKSIDRVPFTDKIIITLTDDTKIYFESCGYDGYLECGKC